MVYWAGLGLCGHYVLRLKPLRGLSSGELTFSGGVATSSALYGAIDDFNVAAAAIAAKRFVLHSHETFGGRRGRRVVGCEFLLDSDIIPISRVVARQPCVGGEEAALTTELRADHEVLGTPHCAGGHLQERCDGAETSVGAGVVVRSRGRRTLGPLVCKGCEIINWPRDGNGLSPSDVDARTELLMSVLRSTS